MGLDLGGHYQGRQESKDGRGLGAKSQADKSQQFKCNAAGWTLNDRTPPNPGHGPLASSSNIFLTAPRSKNMIAQ